jgi:hypothetical protein
MVIILFAVTRTVGSSYPSCAYPTYATTGSWFPTIVSNEMLFSLRTIHTSNVQCNITPFLRFLRSTMAKVLIAITFSCDHHCLTDLVYILEYHGVRPQLPPPPRALFCNMLKSRSIIQNCVRRKYFINTILDILCSLIQVARSHKSVRAES